MLDSSTSTVFRVVSLQYSSDTLSPAFVPNGARYASVPHGHTQGRWPHVGWFAIYGVRLSLCECDLLQIAAESETAQLLAEVDLDSSFNGGGTLRASKAIKLNRDAGPVELGYRIARSPFRGIAK